MYSLAFFIMLFWFIMTSMDYFLKSLLFGPYLYLLKRGLSVRPAYLQWHLTTWNQTFHRWHHWRPNLQTCWFNTGILVTCALLPIAMFFLLKTVLGFFSFGHSEGPEQPSQSMLQPVLPGVNIPLSDAAYYFLTLLFCSIVHEIGHAIAAAREDVPVLGVGLFLLVIFPGAFVELSTEHVTQCTAAQRLRIFCAGVWHNLALVVATGLLLAVTPLLLSSAYIGGTGLVVTHVAPESGLSGSAGLSPGDILLNVSNCPINHSSDWIPCLLQHNSQHSLDGYCTTKHFILEEGLATGDFSANGDQCCPSMEASGLCFTIIEQQPPKLCLPVRKLLENSSGHCHSTGNCSTLSEEFCVKPLLANNSIFLQIRRLNKKAVLFVGSPQLLARAVQVSPYIPRYSFCPLTLPHMLETQLRYLMAFSAALALLNAVPCHGLDGYHVLSALLDWLNCFSRGPRRLLLRLMTAAGSLLLAASVALAVQSLYLQT